MCNASTLRKCPAYLPLAQGAVGIKVTPRSACATDAGTYSPARFEPWAAGLSRGRRRVASSPVPSMSRVAPQIHAQRFLLLQQRQWPRRTIAGATGRIQALSVPDIAIRDPQHVRCQCFFSALGNRHMPFRHPRPALWPPRCVHQTWSGSRRGSVVIIAAYSGSCQDSGGFVAVETFGSQAQA